MSLLELFFIAVGLSMDAFAVSLCKGLVMDRLRTGDGLLVALFFGGFQALMPIAGYYLASNFAGYIEAYDHWVAFLLLLFIGGKMLWDVYKESHSPQEDTAAEDAAAEDAAVYQPVPLGELIVLAVATSIDALAVGVAFAVLPGVHIFSAAGFIGCTTFVLSFIGVVLGFKTGKLLEEKAQILGGLILIAIGVKILLEHSGILG
ncbi:MAG: manganese efflux pump [Firmicutes bacterium]|nr:manganese efflux pump [Bacillota bacterium]